MLLLLFFPLTQYFERGVYDAVIAGSAVGLVNAGIAYFFNKKAIVAERNALLKIFFTGILVRFALVGILFVIVIEFSRLDVIAFAAAVIAFYLLLQFYEVKYLNKQLVRRKKNEDAAQRDF